MADSSIASNSLEDSATKADSATTRERILDASEVLFAKKGFAGTAVRDIARECALTPASLYNHFDGKQALYEAVLERGVHPLLDMMVDFASGEATESETDAFIEALMQHLASRPHLPGLIQHETITGGLAMSRMARVWLRPIVEQGLLRMNREPGGPWEEDEFASVISAWIYIVLGHFSMAPLLREILDSDPLSASGLETQTRFLRKFARIMYESSTSGESTSEVAKS